MFGILYVAVMLSYIYKTRCLEGGGWLVGLIFLSSWGSDTCAYCVGMLIGKHKMAPVLSPKKSVEGGVGGVIGAALLGAIYALVKHSFSFAVMVITLNFSPCSFNMEKASSATVLVMVFAVR